MRGERQGGGEKRASAGARLAAFGAGLAILFGTAYFVAGALVSDETVDAWVDSTEEEHADAHATDGHGDEHAAAPGGDRPQGLALEQDGYVLGPVLVPGAVGERGELSFRVIDPDGEPLRDYATEHERELHLIVVRSDGAEFRHVHPHLDEDGTWSLPWRWREPGGYRVFTDFVPAGAEEGMTLGRDVDVAGELTPVRPKPTASDRVDGFDVTVDGHLHAGEATELTVEVTRDGRPVRDLQPYLGAFGHLVALREGDLAYLHVHAEGEDPGRGETAGPAIAFTTEAPTAGRYLLYLDFKVDGEVHTAELVLDAS